MTGNRCGHDPKHPKLSPVVPIRKGKGGLPRILSLAAERAKAWYFHPQKCKLLQSHPKRKTRSERREACQIVIETILSHLDLASLCLGTPTLENGFIDMDMRTIVRESGIGQRRCERAIALLKEAGFMSVKQPRAVNDQGDYVGLRAIRVVTTLFFEFLNLGPMLQKERARASSRLQRKAMKANRKVTDLIRRMTKGSQCVYLQTPTLTRRPEKARRRNTALEYGLREIHDCRPRPRRVPTTNKRGTRITSRLQPRQIRIAELACLAAWGFSEIWAFLGLAYSPKIEFTDLEQITVETLHSAFTAGKSLPTPRWRPSMLCMSGIKHFKSEMLWICHEGVFPSCYASTAKNKCRIVGP